MSRLNIVLHDRIKELSHTQGTGPFILDGKINGFSPFGDFYEYGDVVFYAATDGVRYEVGSGEYKQDGSNNTLTRFPFRSTNLDSGPYYVNGTSDMNGTAHYGATGYFYPLYLTRSAAMSGEYTHSAHTHTFREFPGQTFYMPNDHAAHGVAAPLSGVNYNASGAPVDFPDAGIKEIYVTYPGKNSVFTGYGVSGYKAPLESGVAFWGTDQALDYSSKILWSSSDRRLGIDIASPEYGIHVGGSLPQSTIAASGFITGGSGIYISGVAGSFSGGYQREPFFRNKLNNETGTDAVFLLKGTVDEEIRFLKQPKGTFLAGPPSGCSPASCSPDYPTFRVITSGDLPDLSDLYVVQDKNLGYNANTIPHGAVALFKESGIITYDHSGIYFSTSNNRLGINTAIPNSTLDVNGDVTISGNLDVAGSVTYIDSSNIAIYDKQIELASMSGNSVLNDAQIDDGGIVLKSKDHTDKKWTWRDSTDAWTTDEKIDVSGVIFNDSSMISGAYHMGSGMTLHNGIELNIGDLYRVSGTDQNARFVHQGRNLIVSGISGIQTKVATQGNDVLLTIDPSGLSGVFQHAIDNSVSYNWKLQAQASGHNMHAVDTIAGGNTVNVSGMSGVRTLYNPTSNVLSIDVSGASGWTYNHVKKVLAGGLTDGYNYWTIKNELGSSTQTENISSTHAVTFSGVSGVNAFYDTNHNRLTLAAVELSGTLQHDINKATSYSWTIESQYGKTETVGNSDTIAFSGASGIETYYDAAKNHLHIKPEGISGHLMYNINKLSNPMTTAGSGLTKVDTTVHMDINGTGQIRSIQFYSTEPSGEEIRIGTTTAGIPSGIVIGSGAAFNLADPRESRNSIAIGTDAMNLASGANNIIAIGQNAFLETSGGLNTLAMGVSAARSGYDMRNSNLVGTNAGRLGSDFTSANGFGTNTLAMASGITQVAAIGPFAGSGASGIRFSNLLGPNAGQDASGIDYINAIGHEAARGLFNSDNVEAMGFEAAKFAKNANNSLFFGQRAGQLSQGRADDTDFPQANMMIGPRAGFGSSGNIKSTYIGLEAGDASISGDHVISLGRNSAANSSGVTHSIFAGQGVGQLSNHVGHSIGIGYEALGGDGGTTNGGGPNGLFSVISVTGVDAIGYNSAKAASGVVYTAGLGYKSMYAASGTSKAVAVGFNAGNQSYDSDFSVLIGHYAGYQSSRKYSLIINPRNNFDPGSWGGDTDGLLEIHDMIHGIHTDANTTNGQKVLSVGATPTDASSLTNVTLGIRPTSTTDTTLQTYSIAGKNAPHMTSERSAGGSTNTIVNKHGFVEIPVAQNYDTGTNKLYFDTGTSDEVPTADAAGMIALYYTGGSNDQLAIWNGTVWRFVTLSDSPL